MRPLMASSSIISDTTFSAKWACVFKSTTLYTTADAPSPSGCSTRRSASSNDDGVTGLAARGLLESAMVASFNTSSSLGTWKRWDSFINRARFSTAMAGWPWGTEADGW
eukprot:CAMPEP_0177683956 /NCGR_PEP_ID=MMETSP0447-20121125/32134_1 /TAXON_ID=0 /ORGANISM="Stygamoeba regulata, Strain BSH-02190019" /LENGTH=108 /DNA_ID=CAMNT_0019193691 /DNA_START=110 /DNA_END=436 /DNA_ORIENTATION=-